jgi:hypothetical protein
MTDLKTRYGSKFRVDRDYAGAIGEDVAVHFDDGAAAASDLLTPDEARALAAALIHHADEVDQINKELA